MQFVYEVILPNKVLRNHLLSENMQWNYASLNVTLIISCTRSWNFAWHLLWRSTTEGKTVVKFLAISQTIHSKCAATVRFTQCTLFFQKVCFLLKICLSSVICGTYVSKINAVLWRSARQSFASFGLFTWLVYVRTYCVPIATLNKTLSELDYAQIKNFPLSRCTWIKSFRIQL